jgi:hypothetical protein
MSNMTVVEKVNVWTAGLGSIVLVGVLGTLWNMNGALSANIASSEIRAKYYERRLDALSHRQEVLEAEVYRKNRVR